MRILILSRSASLYSTERLVLAAHSRGHDVSVLDPHQIEIVVQSGTPHMSNAEVDLRDLDLVIPRLGAGATHYALTVVRQFELLGTPMLNTSEAIDRCRDKLRTLQLLTRKRIGVPTTVCVSSPASVDSALVSVGGCPVIVKLRQGSQGIGTMIAETRQSVASMLETFWAMGQDIVLQEYIRASRGADVRAIVVGGRVVAAMRRTARLGEFRANLHRGGLGRATTLKPSYRMCALAAARAVDVHVAGVDMVETRNGPKVFEVSSSPGLEGIERASRVDVARAIIELAERVGRQRRPRGRRRSK